jgi:hypothetical protein
MSHFTFKWYDYDPNYSLKMIIYHRKLQSQFRHKIFSITVLMFDLVSFIYLLAARGEFLNKFSSLQNSLPLQKT